MGSTLRLKLVCGSRTRARHAPWPRPERTGAAPPGLARPAAADSGANGVGRRMNQPPSSRKDVHGSTEEAAATSATLSRKRYPGKRLGKQRLGWQARG